MRRNSQDNVVNIIRDILDIGQECGVHTIPLSTSDPQIVMVNEYEVISWNFKLLIEGSFQDIARFIGQIDSHDISGATVESVYVSPIVTDNRTYTVPNYAVPARGNIDMVIYARDTEVRYDIQ